MKKNLITDGEMYEAMKKSFNEDINIDPMYVKEIEKYDPQEPLLTWNGAIWDYDGMDIQHQKHPVFDK